MVRTRVWDGGGARSGRMGRRVASEVWRVWREEGWEEKRGWWVALEVVAEVEGMRKRESRESTAVGRWGSIVEERRGMGSWEGTRGSALFYKS